MIDTSFFALLFLLASSLAPGSTRERAWVNERHPEQIITWTRSDEGWGMRVNGREMGVFRSEGDVVVHDTGRGEPARFPIGRLARLRPGARRVELLGAFAPTTLRVEREGPRVRLVDPARSLLRTPLILRAR